jgi:hypothetical protein
MNELNSTERAEIAAILTELELSPFERRRKRMMEAVIRLWGADQHGQPKLTGLADLLHDARSKRRMFTPDECLVVNFGLLPSEVAKMREERERRVQRQCSVHPKEESQKPDSENRPFETQGKGVRHPDWS